MVSNQPALFGITNQASFLAARAAIRTNQFDPNYINWNTLTNNFNTVNRSPSGNILVAPALTELRDIGVQIMADTQTTIANSTNWAVLWKYWVRYYMQAFYLGRDFDVQRYQMENEPDLTDTNMSLYLVRLQLSSDAISCALSDVNSLYGKTLIPMLHAPVVANPISSWPTWGELVVTNRHNNFLGQTDTNYWLFQSFDYHLYSVTPSRFGEYLTNTCAHIQAAMTPESPFPVAVSEFNNHSSANFNATTNTLDTPPEYARFGAAAVYLTVNNASEIYCFNFGRGKQGLCYVDTNNAPYNVGGITKAGEAFRLFNKAFASGRSLLNVTTNAAATNLVAAASYNPVTDRYYLYSANISNTAVSLNLDLSALDLPAGNRVLLEEVSETKYGSGLLWTNLPANSVIPATQNAYTVWLLTAPRRPQQTEEIITASDSAEVCDGANSGINYGLAPTMIVRNDPTNASNRSVALMKFHLPVTNLNSIEFSLLSLQAACASSNCVAQAHVYFLSNTNWSQSDVTWSNAPNLAQNSPPGSNIVNDVIQGVGSNANIIGQLVVSTTNSSEKLIDLTDFLRNQTNTDFSILIVQDPRTNGDVQADGIQIATAAGGAEPCLRLVLASVTATNSVLLWDPNQAPGGQDGSGVWNKTAVTWWNGYLTAWHDGQTAAFGVSASSNCVVTLATNMSPSGIIFYPTGGGAYTLAGGGAINLTSAVTITANNNATISASIQGSGSLTLTGTGTLTLTATNTYTGTTTISNGTLLVNGSLNNSSVAVTASGALGGSGTIKEPVTVNGILISGSPVGPLTINNNLILTSTAVLAYSLGSNSSSVAVISNLTVAGTLNITDGGGFGMGNYTLFTYSGTLTNNGITVGTVPYVYYAYAIDSNSVGQVQLNVSAKYSLGDGIPDWWRARYFGGDGSTTDSFSCATADVDGTGMSNLQKFLAGLDPTNSASVFKITQPEKLPDGSGFKVTWSSVPGKTYKVLYSDSPGGPWQEDLPDSQITAGTGETSLFYTDGTVGASTKRFYKIKLVTP